MMSKDIFMMHLFDLGIIMIQIQKTNLYVQNLSSLRCHSQIMSFFAKVVSMILHYQIKTNFQKKLW